MDSTAVSIFRQGFGILNFGHEPGEGFDFIRVLFGEISLLTEIGFEVVEFGYLRAVVFDGIVDEVGVGFEIFPRAPADAGLVEVEVIASCFAFTSE